MDRLSFVERHLDYIPRHDSYLYYFLAISINRTKLIEKKVQEWEYMLSLASSGPIDKEHFGKVIEPLFKDYDKILKMFSNEDVEPEKSEEEIARELQELNNL